MPNGNGVKGIFEASGWLSHTPADFRARVLERCSFKRLQRGEPVYCAGDPPGGPYGVVCGGLRVYAVSEVDGPTYAHFVRPGHWVGEGTLFTRSRRAIGLTAATRGAEVLHLPLHVVDELVETAPRAWRWFGLLAVMNWQLAASAAFDLMIRDSAARCVAILLRLADRRSDGDEAVDVEISHSELAVMSNLSRSTIVHLLHKLQARGFIVLGYGRVCLSNPAGLRQFLESLISAERFSVAL